MLNTAKEREFDMVKKVNTVVTTQESQKIQKLAPTKMQILWFNALTLYMFGIQKSLHK